VSPRPLWGVSIDTVEAVTGRARRDHAGDDRRLPSVVHRAACQGPVHSPSPVPSLLVSCYGRSRGAPGTDDHPRCAPLIKKSPGRT
jgi:small ligand-binding sensory domain FIST